MDREGLDEVASAHGADLIVRFGSTAKGTSRVDSDADVAVLLTRPPTSYAGLADLTAALQPFFPGREVDLVVLNHADPLLLHQITEQGVLLHGSLQRWHEFRLFAFKRYQDHRRFLQMERDYVDRFVAAAGR